MKELVSIFPVEEMKNGFEVIVKQSANVEYIQPSFLLNSPKSLIEYQCMSFKNTSISNHIDYTFSPLKTMPEKKSIESCFLVTEEFSQYVSQKDSHGSDVEHDTLEDFSEIREQYGFIGNEDEVKAYCKNLAEEKRKEIIKKFNDSRDRFELLIENENAPEYVRPISFWTR